MRAARVGRAALEREGRTMDLMALKYFQFVAMYRNFTRAAEHFYIGQPALSRQIAALEKELGTKLFDRDTRNVELTEAGRVLYANCDLLLRHHDHVRSLIEAAKKGHHGLLSIAVVHAFATQFARFIQAFQDAYPGVHVRVDDIPFDELYDSIVHGVYEAAFAPDFAVPANELIARTPVADDEIVAVVRRDRDHGLGDEATVEQLLAVPLIIPSHVHPPFLNHLRLRDRALARPESTGISYTPNSETAILQASMGHGVTFMPQSVVAMRPELGALTVCRILGADTSFQMLLIRRKDNSSMTVRNLVDVVRDERRVRRAPR